MSHTIGVSGDWKAVQKLQIAKEILSDFGKVQEEAATKIINSTQ